MTFQELYNQKIKRGDIVVMVTRYKSIGPSTWSGPVISTNPLVLFPYSGNNGYLAITNQEREIDYFIIHNPFYVRWFLFIGALFGLLRIGKK